MATIIESTDAAFGSATTYSFVEGDIFQGDISPSDTRDTISADLVAGQTYTISLTGYGPSDTLDLSYQYDSYTQYGGIGTGYASTGDVDLFSTVQADGTMTMTFTANFTGTYYFTVFSTTDVISYDLIFGPLPATGPVGPTAGADDLTGTSSSDTVDLLAGDDTFAGGNGSDNVQGNAGRDVIYGENGNDTLDGGDDDDTLDGGSGNDWLSGGSGIDDLFGGNDNDWLDGGDDADTLRGGNHDDSLIGGGGGDLLDGGAGDDEMTGGAGADIFALLSSSGSDTITDFEDGIDTIDVSALGISDLSMLSVIQTLAGARIQLPSSAHVTLNGVNVADIDASDFIFATPTPVTATSGADRFEGTSAADVFDGAGGADAIFGMGGDDDLAGGTGKDTIKGGGGNDQIDGGSGDDQLFGEDGRDTINGSSGNDKILGGDGNDVLNGQADNDRLYGEGGRDLLFGDNGNDRIWGGADNDALDGGAGKDKLYGDNGDDTLAGGFGDDLLEGGNGADVFVFADRMRADIITDFEDGSDLLDFTAFGFTDISDLSITQVGADTEVRVNTRDAVLLENFDAADLTNDDFIFGFVPPLPPILG